MLNFSLVAAPSYIQSYLVLFTSKVAPYLHLITALFIIKMAPFYYFYETSFH